MLENRKIRKKKYDIKTFKYLGIYLGIYKRNEMLKYFIFKINKIIHSMIF
jgi:hypothetical protein